MRVTKQDLINFGLFDNLPQPLKDMTDGYYFVFYYRTDEELLKLKIYEFDVVKQVNVSLYRNMETRMQKYGLVVSPYVGFFSNTFESRDGLFFQFLKTYNDEEKVFSFYRYAKSKDEIIDCNVSTNAVNEVYNSDDFRRAVSYFSEGSLQPVMLVYDIVNEVFKTKLSKSLYGGTIKKVVNLVKYDGGVLPEINGRLRFMVIGENANLTEEQQEKLKEAKLLVRSLEVSMDDIYLTTGWAMGDSDGKWRTNITDDKAEISDIHLFDFNGRKLYVPDRTSITKEAIEGVLTLVNEPQKMYSLNYRGKLIDVLNHPTLYEYYPQLATMPVVYYFGEKVIFDKKGSPIEMFYRCDDERGGFIMIYGSTLGGRNSLSTLLHETQHAIQSVEGFARGGNQFLAQFVASVGSSSVRKIFASINRMEKYFRDKLYTDEERLKIIELFLNQIPNGNQSKSLREMIVSYMGDLESYRNNYTTINFYLVLYIAEEGDMTSDIVSYLQEKVGDVVYELFENINEGYDGAKNYMKQLMSEGYRKEDISKILYTGYQNLYGELESRSVQESRLLGSEFKNYFYLTKWENSPIQQITVIDGVENVLDCTKITAAVEDKDGSYVMHFQLTYSCVPFLHELGHIVKDALFELGYQEQIEREADKEFEDVEEFFVSKFLVYLKKNIDDEKLREDLRYDFTTENEVINNILHGFFENAEPSERLKFLQNMLT